MRLSSRVRTISPSPTMAVDAKSKQMLAEGIDVVNFGVGEPDFETPAHIKAAGIKAIETGFTRYVPASGTLELRKAICEKLKRDNGLEYTPEQIVVSCGAKQSLFNTYQAILEPGDEVILQAPYWVSYPEMIKLAGGVPVVVQTDAASDFKMTPEQIRAALTPRTVAINLNSPSNPTGAVYTRAELQAIADLAVEKDLIIVTDEMYEKLIYGGAEHVSIASLGPEIKKRTITINGHSKAYAMTGWRVGYTASELDVAKAMANLQSHSSSGTSSISQKAAFAALQASEETVEAMRQEFDRRRQYVVDRMQKMPGISCPTPLGAFYVFPSMAGLIGKRLRGTEIRTADDFANLVLDHAHVGLVSGTGFGNPQCFRISYATSMERLQTGLDRIEALLREAE